MKKKYLIIATMILLAFPCRTNAQWYPQNVPLQSTVLNDVFALNEGEAIIAGGMVGDIWGSLPVGLVLRTTNGGENWTQQLSSLSEGYYSVYFLNKNLGWVLSRENSDFPPGGDTLKILKTTNAGDTWNSYFIGMGGANKLQFTDQNTGYVFGWYRDIDETATTMFKTTNGGVSWSQVMLPGWFFFEWSSFYFINKDTGYLIGDHIEKTTDGGNSWIINLSEKYFYQDLNLICFVDSLNGYIAGTEYDQSYQSHKVIFKTVDGGNNWTKNNLNFSNYLSDICFVNKNNGWIVGSSGLILYTSDGGKNWEPESSGTNNDLSSVHFADTNAGWAVGSKGTILKANNGGTTLQIAEKKASGIISYDLFQNYPNPFNPTTNIKYSIPEASLITIKVYDLLGNEIKTLVNQEKPAGTYVSELNASGFPSGVYFYKLTAGKFSSVKKMIIIR